MLYINEILVSKVPMSFMQPRVSEKSGRSSSKLLDRKVDLTN